jgi:hypothetical protein
VPQGDVPTEAGTVIPGVLVGLLAAGENERWAEFVESWRAFGPRLWLLAAGAGALWFLAYGLVLAVTDPRRVTPEPGTLDLGGPEPPAVVNLITHDWELDRTAVPATLLDLAARGHLRIERPGERTVVGLRQPPPSSHPDDLSDYEQMVLDHVRRLADDTPDGLVPAPALATGPSGASDAWWRRFRRHVVRDAKARGVSRNRWPRAATVPMTLAAAAVGVLVALAASTIDQPDRPTRSRRARRSRHARRLRRPRARLDRDAVDLSGPHRRAARRGDPVAAGGRPRG